VSAGPDRVRCGCWLIRRGNRRYLRSRGIKACIPSKSDQDAHRKPKVPRAGVPLRSIRSFTGYATPSRTASPDSNATAASPPAYDKLAVRFQATLTITIISEWL
jgi:hypothetical protein